MPSNIAHMLICHKAINRVHNLARSIPYPWRKSLERFLSLIEDEAMDCDGSKLRAYLNLGSVGPDIFSYKSFKEMAKVMIKLDAQGAIGADAFAYQAHSCRPNDFPFRLLQIFFKDLKTESDGDFAIDLLEPQDYAKLAFTAGYLTHVAADQVIHPLVNRHAGPYYRCAANRERHRIAEIHQDLFLYNYLYGDPADPDRFFGERFGEWIDVLEGVDHGRRGELLKEALHLLSSALSPRRNASASRRLADWFDAFVDRGFAETYGLTPAPGEFRDSVYGMTVVLAACNLRNGKLPYERADVAWKNRQDGDGEMQGAYDELFEELGYKAAYREAVELAAVYLLALFEAFSKIYEGTFSGRMDERRFKSVVSDADLGTPLVRGECILDKAIVKFWNGSGLWQKEVQLKTRREIQHLDPWTDLS